MDLTGQRMGLWEKAYRKPNPLSLENPDVSGVQQSSQPNQSLLDTGINGKILDECGF